MEIFKVCNVKQPDAYGHQKQVAEILAQMDLKGNFSTIVTVPTGGGKTKIAVDFCLERLESGNNRVVWMSDSVDLLIQSMERFRDSNTLKELKYQFLCGTNVYSNFRRNKENKENVHNISIRASELNGEADIIFASVETLVQDKSYGDFSKWLGDVQENGKVYIIYDEVHHIGAEKTNELFEKLHGFPDGKPALSKFGMIGLTATVYRHDSPVWSFNRWFKNGYTNDGEFHMDDTTKYGDGVNQYISNRIEVVTIQKLIDEGILIKPKLIRVDDFEKGIPSKKEGMQYLAKKIKRNYKKKKWNKTIVFVDTLEDAFNLAGHIGNKLCFAYVSDWSEKDGDSDIVKKQKKIAKDTMEDDFKNFKATDGTHAKIMIAVDKVSEGFDVKDVETIYLYPKVLSHVSIRQKVGRVLRTADGKENATVYWQNYDYFDKNDRKTAELNRKTAELKDIPYDRDIEEGDVEIKSEIGRWKKGLQQPAGMYLKEIPKDITAEREFCKLYEYLHILNMFGLDIALEGIGYYKTKTDERIYARQKEKKGYEQFYRVIRSDYFSLLIHKEGDFTSFRDYAKALGVPEQDLLDDIKKSCFYMPNASLKDTKGRIAMRAWLVRDEDIKKFYEYVVKNDLKMPEYEDVSATNDTSTEDGTDENSNSGEAEASGGSPLQAAAFSAYLKGKKPSSTLLDGINLYNEFLQYTKTNKSNEPKRYTDTLTYGKYNNVTYHELLSVRAIMSVGAVASTRVQGELHGIRGSLALIGKSESKTYAEINVLARTVTDIYETEDDLLIFAQALVTVPDHISVKNDDVKEYQTVLLKALEREKVSIASGCEVQVTREFLMALGYYGNDDIIRMQCELFKGDMPCILQYVIYCKIYNRLSQQVKFYGDDGKSSPICLNTEELRKTYTEMLDGYGITALNGDLTPADDVITDYRPYMKAVPYYQGIKPEFLCRMLNKLLMLNGKKKKVFVDAFGGSGTVSMNIDSTLQLKQEYNDLGILNKAFFDEIKDDRGSALKKRVKEFIDLVFYHTGDETKAKQFLKPYKEVINSISNNPYDFTGDLTKVEKKYQKRFNKKTKELSGKAEKLAERLSEKEKKFKEVISKTFGEADTQEFRKIEEFVHPMLLLFDRIFHELKGKERLNDIPDSSTPGSPANVDLAFIFYMFNSLSSRHFYNDASIDKIARFAGTYEQNIDCSADIFKNIEVHRKDAMELIENQKDDEKKVWYCDIPYSETNIDTYADDWFDGVSFVDVLSNCKGDYIIASRFNICEDGARGLGRLEKNGLPVKEKTEKALRKEQNIIKFFSRFVSKEFFGSYSDLVQDKYVETDSKESRNAWSSIKDERTAKYVVFAYSQTEEIRDTKKHIHMYVKNHMPVSKDSIRRMLKNTQISNVEVELMLTNMELDMEGMPVAQVDTGIWYVPAFKTATSYKTEPVTVIMNYETFVFDMVLYLITENDYETVKIRENAAAFYKMFESKKAESK